jgi:hypothetical protein
MSTPRDVDRLLREMEAELRAIARDKSIGLSAAISRINAVIAEFVELAESLDDRRDVATDETTPEPSSSASSDPASETPAPAEATPSPDVESPSAEPSSDGSPSVSSEPSTSGDTSAEPSGGA